jgi:TldD protein
MRLQDSFVAQKFGLTERNLERYLAEALARGAEYAELYFEYVATTRIKLDESIIKAASNGVSAGVGIRVLSAERTGYAYTDDLNYDKILQAVRVSACIADGPSTVESVGFTSSQKHNLYPVVIAPGETALEERLKLVQRANRAARAYDRRVYQVQVDYTDNLKHVLVANSRGILCFDRQPLVKLSVTVLARNFNSPSQRGHAGGGGRVSLDFFTGEKSPEYFATEAARRAIVQLDAIEAPAGEMTVVLGPGWSGILLHEAVGHGLEADFNCKGVSAFTNRVGQRVANPLCTVIDDGTIANRRGSLNIDDEGVATQRNVLIEKGVLRGYLQDSLSARLMKSALVSTGNGRRQSYRHIPMPRMTNTFMLAGDSDPADIIRSVSGGLYCANIGGGQVDITSGNFVFSASESFLIEGGKVTSPVRGATLIGNGPETLHHISMIGADFALDEGIGICTKEGQSVEIGVGIPTVRIDHMIVGGTAL